MSHFEKSLAKKLPASTKKKLKRVLNLLGVATEHKAAKPAKKSSKPDRTVARIMAATGWDHEKAAAQLKAGIERTGCTPWEYWIYHFYERAPEEQCQVALHWMGSAISKKYNSREFLEVVKDKEKTNQRFEAYLHRRWCVNTKVSEEEFRTLFSGCSKLIYKPILGSKGQGVEAFAIGSSDNAANGHSSSQYTHCRDMGEVYRTLSAYPAGVVEEYVVQHPEMSRLCPDSVNTLRIVTVCSQKHPVTPDGKYMEIAYAGVRMGMGGSIVDNAHSGGLCTQFDPASGKIITNGVGMSGQIYETHPATGTTIKGFQIPLFKEVLAMLEKLCREDVVEGLVGWDIAVTENGPVLIEINQTPGTVLLSLPHSTDRVPTRRVYDRYLTPEEFSAALKAAGGKKTRKSKEQKRQEKRERIISAIMEKTGWSREETLAKAKKAKKRTGYGLEQYYQYFIFELTPAEQEQVCPRGLAQKVREKYDTEQFIELARQKNEANRYFSEFIRRPWCVNTDTSKKEFRRLFSESTRVIYKPYRGHKGQGVEAFTIDRSAIDKVYKTISRLPMGVVEEYVVQHPEMSRLCPASVNTLRVVTVCSKKQPVTADGKYEDVAYAALRVGRGSSVVDNYSSGGMCAFVDLATGKIITDAVDGQSRTYSAHPTTGVAFQGFQIPYFKEALDMALAGSRKELIEGMVGWDIAITETGPILIEVNNMPGTVLLIPPCAHAKIPSKPIFSKYLTPEELAPFTRKHKPPKDKQVDEKTLEMREKSRREKAFVRLWKANGRKVTKQAVCALFGVPFDGEDEVYSLLRYKRMQKIKSLEAGCLVSFGVKINENGEISEDTLEAAQSAMDAGAKRILCNRQIGDFPCLVVPGKNSFALASRIASVIRKQYLYTGVTVTGSYGKTTTTALIGSVLGEKYNTFEPRGRNTNTFFDYVTRTQQVDENCQIFLQEVAEAPTFKSPARITRVLRPKISVITNIGTSHLEAMGSQQRILESCLTVQKGMPRNGILVLNADDPLLWGVTANHRIVYYGYQNEKADYFAANIQTLADGIHFDVIHHGTATPVVLHCIGKHNVQNATAAFAVGMLSGLTEEEIVAGLANYRPQGVRQNLVEGKLCRFYLDCFNASRESMKSALDTLETLEVAPGGRRIAVLADIKEAGTMSEDIHRQVGQYVCQKNVDILLCYGEEAEYIAQEAEKSPTLQVLRMDSHQSIVDYLQSEVTDKDIVLLKGSHGMELDKVYFQIEGRPTPESESDDLSAPDIPEPIQVPQQESPKRPTKAPLAKGYPADAVVQKITVTAVGDCTLGKNQIMESKNSWGQTFEDKGAAYFLKNVAPILKGSDVAIANLEGVLTDDPVQQTTFYRQRADRFQEKVYCHLGKPPYLEALTTAGITAVSFANNHNIDYGVAGFVDTVKTCDKYHLPVAYYDKVVRQRVGDMTVGIISGDFTYCSDEVGETYLRRGMADLRRDCQLIIACIHWGSNYKEMAGSTQRRLGRLCIDLGADMVLGCHAHILQGVERYKGRYIFYSLGNFCYGGRKAPKDNDTAMVQQTFTFVNGQLQRDDQVKVIPCWMSGQQEINDFCPEVKQGAAAQAIMDKLNDRSQPYGVAFDSEGRALVEKAAINTITPPEDGYVPIQPGEGVYVPEIIYTLTQQEQ